VRLRWSAAARHDFIEARDFIASENPAAARSWAIRIRRSVHRVHRFPLAGQALEQTGLRATTVPGTSHRIVYAVQPDAIVIVALWHGAREWPFD
jgi:toxin ParE1/3/4